jgi:hypothetical protein
VPARDVPDRSLGVAVRAGQGWDVRDVGRAGLPQGVLGVVQLPAGDDVLQPLQARGVLLRDC